jgi:hypothetical protein
MLYQYELCFVFCLQLKSQPGESSSVLSRVSDLASILIAASEFVGQHVSSLLKVIVVDQGLSVPCGIW